MVYSVFTFKWIIWVEFMRGGVFYLLGVYAVLVLLIEVPICRMSNIGKSLGELRRLLGLVFSYFISKSRVDFRKRLGILF